MILIIATQHIFEEHLSVAASIKHFPISMAKIFSLSKTTAAIILKITKMATATMEIFVSTINGS